MDARVTGAALTGSTATGTADRWSDVDVFLGLADGAGLADGLEVDLAFAPAGAFRRPGPSVDWAARRSRWSWVRRTPTR